MFNNKKTLVSNFFFLQQRTNIGLFECVTFYVILPALLTYKSSNSETFVETLFSKESVNLHKVFAPSINCIDFFYVLKNQ